MSLSAEELKQLHSNFDKIDIRFREIVKLLPFNKVLSVSELNDLLMPLYESLLKTAIINKDGTINKQDIYSNFPYTHYLGYKGHDILDSVYSIEFDPEIEVGSLIWNGYVTSQEFRFINEKFIEFAREHKLTKMIRDTRNFTILSPADQAWFMEYMIPRFREFGILYSAIIIPNNEISRLLVLELVKEADPYGIHAECFSTPEEAKSWLTSVEA